MFPINPVAQKKTSKHFESLIEVSSLLSYEINKAYQDANILTTGFIDIREFLLCAIKCIVSTDEITTDLLNRSECRTMLLTLHISESRAALIEFRILVALIELLSPILEYISQGRKNNTIEFFWYNINKNDLDLVINIQHSFC